ncbi:MAG: alpha-L-rhamnosidase C-terminal domain-containing protein [Thermoguttaceae bacterium]
MKRLIFLLVLLLFCLIGHVFAGNHFPPTNDFKANWVLAPNLPNPVPENLWFVFRKSFDLNELPEKAVCRISCDSKYWLFVNGKMVVFEGQLKRGPTPNDTYFDVVDLSRFLHKGKNTIAVLMWYFGKEGFSHKSSGMPGFLLDATTNGPKGLELVSDATWKGAIHTFLGSMPEKNPETGQLDIRWKEIGVCPYERYTADPQPNMRLSESNIRYDARYDYVGDWKSVDFDDSQWDHVKEVGVPPIAPWNELYERPIPLWKDYGLKDYVNKDELPEISTTKSIRCKLPYNAQITPYLKVDAPEGLTIDIRTDNYMGGSEYNVRAEYITKAGVQEYESLGWMNGHEVIYTMPVGVKILDLKFRETGFDSEFAGSFECDDPFFNELWKKAQRTLYITMRDNYFDCPDRERAQWWGDAVNELGEAFYALDPKSATIARKGMYELMNWQRPDGIIYSPIPGIWDKELPLQMLASIGPYGFGTWVRYTGDQTPIFDLYDRMEKYMDVWKFGDDDLILHRTGAWDWGDWGENIDLRVLANCWYYLALKSQYDWSKLVENEQNVQKNNVRKRLIEANFDKVFWNGKEYRDPGYKGKTDDRANAMSVISGLAKKENYPKIREVLLKQKHASPYMEKYILEALFKMGYEEDALARMKERFTKMVEHPDYTTLWEGWGIGNEGYGGGTINHAWSGGGLTMLSQYATGVQVPEYGGFKNFIVSPQMGSLKWIKSTTPTPFGPIVVNLDQQNGQFEMALSVPDGTRGHVRIPAKYADSTEQLHVRSGLDPDSPKVPVDWKDERENGYFYAPFSEGTWVIQATK